MGGGAGLDAPSATDVPSATYVPSAPPVCFDLAASECLRDAHSAWHTREVDRLAEKRREAHEALAESIGALTSEREAWAGASERERAEGAAQHEARERVLEHQLTVAGTRADEADETLRLRDEMRHEWEVSLVEARGASARVPVFPVGDALMEPFWPQGLGSNRGFHSALDAAWAIHLLRTEGLEAALLDRSFTFDVLQGSFGQSTVRGGAGWSADAMSRYSAPMIKSMMHTYMNPTAKRLMKGKGAIPERYWPLFETALAMH